MRLLRIPTAILFVAVTSATAGAQSLTELIRQSPVESYYVMKDTFRSTMISADFSSYPPDPNEIYDISFCETSEILLEGGRYYLSMLLLAADTVRVEAMLAWLGYPDPVWRPLLESFEAQQLSLLGWPDYSYDATAFAVTLKANLAQYRATDSSVAEVEWEPACGGHGLDILITTTPSGGTVRLIPVFQYKYCERMNLDPNDPWTCDQWVDHADGEMTLLGGVYQYVAIWADGTERRGRKAAEASAENIDEGLGIVEWRFTQ